MNKAVIFKDIFGESWDQLPLVLRKHYANRAYTDDRVVVEGILDIHCKSYMKLLRPFYRILGSLPAVTLKNVPVTVCFDSAADGKAFHFNRVFHFDRNENFKNGKAYQFRSRMLQTKGCEVIEVMRFGICWRMDYRWDGDRVTLNHKGYALRLLGYYLPVPITALIGRGDAVETAVDDDHFDMEVTMTHPLFGVVYSYAGRFKVTKEA